MSHVTYQWGTWHAWHDSHQDASGVLVFREPDVFFFLSFSRLCMRLPFLTSTLSHFWQLVLLVWTDFVYSHLTKSHVTSCQNPLQVSFHKRATNYWAHLGKWHIKIRHPRILTRWDFLLLLWGKRGDMNFPTLPTASKPFLRKMMDRISCTCEWLMLKMNCTWKCHITRMTRHTPECSLWQLLQLFFFWVTVEVRCKLALWCETWLRHDSFHWKCYSPEIHQIEKLRFLGIAWYKFKL